MPSPRRTKALLIGLITVLALTLFLTYNSSQQSPSLRTLQKVTEAEGLAAMAPPPPAPVYVEARAEIMALLEAHAVVVFSKSYCPYSKKAKVLLLQKYNIVPAPFVVELDLKTNGMQIQEELEAVTGRGTVPNVMVAGKSIGGGDDVEKLDKDGTLEETLRQLGRTRITQVSVVKPVH